MFWYWQVDGWIALAGMLCAIACALVGNFLVLRRLSLMGDAISHAVLPGIAAAFLWTGTRSHLAVLIGAAVLGVVTVWLTELVRRYGSVEESAAIGVVFTGLFALGIMLIARAEHVDLDPSCVLYGNLETIILDVVRTPIGDVPKVVLELSGICALNALLVALLYKQWMLSSFDPMFAKAQGISAGFFHYLLATMVALTCITAFQAVGNILVVAMLIVPSAAAFLLCRRLSSMIGMSILIAGASAWIGHLSAIVVPHAFGWKSANSAAMIAITAGLILLVCSIASPKGGVISKWISQRKMLRRILGEDILAMLYRQTERRRISDAVDRSEPEMSLLTTSDLALRLKELTRRVESVAHELSRAGYLVQNNDGWVLTESGHRTAQNLVRSHRLWEQFLSVEAGVSERRLHAQAESLEHYTDRSMRGELDREVGNVSLDPHGKAIPPEG